jgi:ADP-ribose pyrophosphatase YjhB (NUDIX family)
VIAYRIQDGKVRVLLMTSRDTGRWIIPKGNIKPGVTPRRAAEQEAYEMVRLSKSRRSYECSAGLAQRAVDCLSKHRYRFAVSAATPLDEVGGAFSRPAEVNPPNRSRLPSEVKYASSGAHATRSTTTPQTAPVTPTIS